MAFSWPIVLSDPRDLFIPFFGKFGFRRISFADPGALAL
jgi:hypothetical protein